MPLTPSPQGEGLVMPFFYFRQFCFACIVPFREGKPLPYGERILFTCRGGVPPPDFVRIKMFLFGPSRTLVPTDLNIRSAFSTAKSV